jgi:hypothetical protein
MPTMPFGKHKGLEMSEVPEDYLRWLWRNVRLTGHLRDEIREELTRRSGYCDEEERYRRGSSESDYHHRYIYDEAGDGEVDLG